MAPEEQRFIDRLAGEVDRIAAQQAATAANLAAASEAIANLKDVSAGLAEQLDESEGRCRTCHDALRAEIGAVKVKVATAAGTIGVAAGVVLTIVFKG